LGRSSWQQVAAVSWGLGRRAYRLWQSWKTLIRAEKNVEATPTTHEILERLREEGKILLKIKNHHAGVERNPITGSKEKFLLINFLRYLWKS